MGRKEWEYWLSAHTVLSIACHDFSLAVAVMFRHVAVVASDSAIQRQFDKLVLAASIGQQSVGFEQSVGDGEQQGVGC